MTLAVIGWLGAAVIVTRIYWPTKSLVGQARDVTLFALEGDASRVAESIAEVELADMKVSRSQIRRAFNEVILVPFRQCSLYRERGSLPDQAGMIGSYFADLKLPSGSIMPIAIGVWQSDEQGSVPFEGWLRISWNIAYRIAGLDASKSQFAIWSAGLERDRDRLASLGIAKIACLDGKTLSVDDLLARYEQLARQDQRKK